MDARFERRRPVLSLLVLVLALTTMLTLSLAADPPALEQENVKTAKGVVPFEMLASNHMMVLAKINGKGPFRLIFDLGAPITLLSNRAGEAADVVKKDAPKSLLFAMRGESEVKSLEVGGLTAKNLPVIVFDHPALRALGGFFGRPLDGIIGFTFFARYKTTIDYQAREMTFEPVDFKMRDLLKDLPDRLAGPKVAHRRMLSPVGLLGMTVAEPADPLNAMGVPVVAVLAGSPAEAAGLKTGDVLTALDGRWTSSVSDTFAAASSAPSGRALEAIVIRDGKELTLSVVPRDGI